MRSVALALTCLLLPGSLEAQELLAEATFFVNSTAAPGGDGSPKKPFARLTDAVAAGKPLAATHDVAIKVASGTYTLEARPIVLDYRVVVKGPTELTRDEDRVATGELANVPATIQSAASTQPMFLVTGPEPVAVRGLVLNGGGSGNGFNVDKAADFAIDGVHISNVGSGIVVSASAGRIEGSFVGAPATFGATIFGGDDTRRTDVRFIRNRLHNYSGGAFSLQGAGDPFLPREPFDTVTATIDGNKMHTDQEINDAAVPVPLTGPSNPYGVRLNAVNDAMMLSTQSHGTIIAHITNNVLTGNHRYPLLITAGQTRREANRNWSGDLDLHFDDNQWERGNGTISSVIITFTNSRLGKAPEWFELATAQEYAERSTYLIRHHGELYDCVPGANTTACHVDHVEIEPCDGRTLNNTLVINGEEIGHGTFIPDVCP